MFALCIESSHKRGMGHFFRALNILDYLRHEGESAIVCINEDEKSLRLLDERNVVYEIVDYGDVSSNWEKRLIHKYHINVWFLDKFETGTELAVHVKNEGILLVAVDDSGQGAELADLHFCSMLFHELRGKKIYAGKDYMILNPEIAKYRRQRTELKKILITLGGSDTYGVTVKIVQILKSKGYGADIIIGPNFRHIEQLEKAIDGSFTVYKTVPSLVSKFNEYDLAITGGGVTGFEANASGLPCLIIASELHEIDNGRYLASFGGARFAGYYKNMKESVFDLEEIDISSMSINGMNAFQLNGLENIYHEIRLYREA